MMHIEACLRIRDKTITSFSGQGGIKGMEIPYEGAKEMLLVDNVDNREFLTELVTAMYDELPEMKKKR